MKIKMLSTQKGADDGINVVTYEQGKTYTVGESLGNAFVNADMAVEVKDKKKGNGEITKAEIMAGMDERGIEYDKGSTKAELITQLEEMAEVEAKEKESTENKQVEPGDNKDPEKEGEGNGDPEKETDNK